jgi:hypothetical protein
MLTSVSKNFSIFLEDNQEYEHEIKVSVTAYFDYESDYGADADGNRGVSAFFLEDYKIDEIECNPLEKTDKYLVDLVEDKVARVINDIDFDIAERFYCEEDF